MVLIKQADHLLWTARPGESLTKFTDARVGFMVLTERFIIKDPARLQHFHQECFLIPTEVFRATDKRRVYRVEQHEMQCHHSGDCLSTGKQVSIFTGRAYRR